MGCDIHMCTELWTKNGWVASDKYSYWNYGANYDAKEPYHGRNYALFGRLAGVRYDGVEPIDEPRGLPDDVSNSVAKDHEQWGCDAHSTSWFNLTELLAPGVWDVPIYQHDQLTRLEFGCLEAQGKSIRLYELLKGDLLHGYTFLGGNSQRVKDRRISNAQMRQELRHCSEIEGVGYLMDGWCTYARTFTETEWSEPFTEYCSDFVAFLHRIKQLRKDPEDVRIVFWFDN